MNILVIGGTRFMGKHLVNALVKHGHSVTIATRGSTPDPFGEGVKRIRFQRTDENSIRQVFAAQKYDVVFDSLAYCSNDMRILLKHLPADRYVYISTTAVYDKHINTVESDFDPLSEEVVWCERSIFPYAESKRQAERALAQMFPHVNSVAVRFPFVIGKDDYTQRLRFYVEHILSGTPMYVDNFENQMAFVRSDEAGKFVAFFAENDFTGKVNGASAGTISIKNISDYVKERTGKSALLSENGDPAPYNGENAYTINTDLASSLGFSFTPLAEWIYSLLDFYIDEWSRT